MDRELRRMNEIDRKLAKAKARYRKISHTFAQVKAERDALEKQINALHDEKNSLSQGQLMLRVPRGTPQA